jgi:Holliday junction DNA helicase RuvB
MIMSIAKTVVMPRERIVSAAAQSDEENRLNYALRPQKFDQYVGQEPLIEKLKIAVEAARTRKEPVEHTLLHGPPGLGKTTLAHVIANEVGAQVFVTSGPALTKAADLVGILQRLSVGDLLFIDEIHRLSNVVEEYLYPAMEDFKVDITLDAGVHARVVTIPVQPFTLIGATTRLGLLTAPMRGRFGLNQHLEFYSPPALQQILKANTKLLGLEAEGPALAELSQRSRGTPRIANRLLRRARDYAAVKGTGKLTLPMVRAALELEGIDDKGLDEQDRQFLRTMIETYDGGPVGIEAIAATMGEERETLEDVIEPYLLQTKPAMLTRTRQGRRATRAAYEHLKLRWKPPKDANGDGPTFFGDAADA